MSLRRILAFPLTAMLVELIGAMLFVLVGSATLYRVLPAYPSHQHSLFAQWLTALIAVGVLLDGARFVEHRSWGEVGFPAHGAVRGFVLGIGGGALVMCSVFGVLALAGWYHIENFASPGDSIQIVLVWGAIFLGAAIFEEVLFRGIIFRLLEETVGSWMALALSAIFFGLSHLFTPNATIWGVLAIALTAGVASSALYMLTRSLWPLIGAHWAWNFLQGPVFGAHVSGNVGIPSITLASIQGSMAWTGGQFGPESGLVVVLLVGGLGLWFLVQYMRRSRPLMPIWQRDRQEAIAQMSTAADF